MKPVFVSPRAYADIRYLEAWLAERNTAAALKVGPLLFEAMMSLREFPERGRRAVNYRGRELNVPFGAHAYIIRYRVEPDRVIIATVHHSLERR